MALFTKTTIANRRLRLQINWKCVMRIKDFYCVFVRFAMNLIAFSGPRNCVNTQPYLGLWDGLRDHLARFRDTFLSSDHSHVSVNDMWVIFKSEVIAAIKRFIPTKMTKTKYSLPWIDSLI